LHRGFRITCIDAGIEPVIGRRRRPQLCDELQNLLEHVPGNGDLGHPDGNGAIVADDPGAGFD
jgi:hypothetical protein